MQIDGTIQSEAFPPEQHQYQNIGEEENEFFEVEHILAHLNDSGNHLYFVKWHGYDVTESTWEPASNFLGEEAVEILVEFEHQRKKKMVEVKLGTLFMYENVPGKLMVKRQTDASMEPQYLFAGQTAWTTNGVNRFGRAELDFATGTMTIPNFSENDVGTYTFPMEKHELKGICLSDDQEATAKTKIVLRKEDY
ncbi:hypothetical protein niasHT_031392 [Heterodera trifolii]|uniref:Chromo domain-containing protein n=1 Tax=Heterodera trifolii TaxID=157864 RepID=A0ABD2J5D8_9BILA